MILQYFFDSKKEAPLYSVALSGAADLISGDFENMLDELPHHVASGASSFRSEYTKTSEDDLFRDIFDTLDIIVVSIIVENFGMTYVNETLTRWIDTFAVYNEKPSGHKFSGAENHATRKSRITFRSRGDREDRNYQQCSKFRR